MPTNVRALMLGAREPHTCMVFPSERAVAIGRESVGVVMAHRGLHEAELVDQDTVALTLVRSVGWLARGDLDSRSGDAGPEIFTPGAQCLREIATDIMVAPCASFADARGAQGNRVVEEFLHPVLRLSTDGLVQGDASNGSDRHFPTAMQLGVNPPIVPATEAAGAILPSALKPSEDHRSVVLRVFNPEPAATIAVFAQEVQRVALQENADEATALPALRWTIGAGEIATFRRELPRPLPTQAIDWRSRFAAVLEGRLPYHRYGVVRGRLAPTAWDWLFGPAPSKGGDLGARFASKAATAERAYVEEVFGEECYRADRLRQEAKNAREQSAIAAAADRNMEDPRTIELRSRASTLHRQTLEAELSVVFAEWDLARYHRTVSSSDRDKLSEEIRRIALELNHSRVAKRTDDYLAALAHE
ncbi:MAG: hypothetical protein KAU31_16405 [Spirochaetaceae bacterium]|nr:hypothetical protein [Spirochaetaceae bacterium]